MAGTRERILDAARSLFLREGFAGTAVTAIEKDASLAGGTGSFYRHFRSKADVLRAVIDREIDQIDQSRSDLGLPRPGRDPRLALALEFQRRLANLRRIQPLMLLVQREHRHLGPTQDHLRELLVEHNLSVRSERLAEWMAAGLIPDRDPEALAATILCSLTGYHLSVAFFGAPPGGISEDVFVATLVDLVAS